MIKYCKEKLDKNEYKLRNKIMDCKTKEDWNYEDIVKISIDNILNDDDDINWDIENITVIDNGDYQGTELYLIPRKTYQPSEYEYIMTYVGYGSCSGCDTLLCIQDYGNSEEEQVNEYMRLCKDIICNIIKPYNHGWRSDDIFNQVEVC